MGRGRPPSPALSGGEGAKPLREQHHRQHPEVLTANRPQVGSSSSTSHKEQNATKNALITPRPRPAPRIWFGGFGFGTSKPRCDAGPKARQHNGTTTPCPGPPPCHNNQGWTEQHAGSATKTLLLTPHEARASPGRAVDRPRGAGRTERGG